MHQVPIKLTKLRKGSVAYYVGVDGVFPDNADAVNATTALIKKLMQIKAYCSKYGKPVIVLINSSRVPKYVHTAIKALRIQMISVVTRDADAKYGDYYVAGDPLVFIARNSEVVLLLTPENSEEDVDFGDVDTAQVLLSYPLLKETVSITTNPNEVVENYKLPKPNNGSPYAAFYHEPLFRRVPYTYWQDLMDTMPDTRDLGNGIPNNVF